MDPEELFIGLVKIISLLEILPGVLPTTHAPALFQPLVFTGVPCKLAKTKVCAFKLRHWNKNDNKNIKNFTWEVLKTARCFKKK